MKKEMILSFKKEKKKEEILRKPKPHLRDIPCWLLACVVHLVLSEIVLTP